MIRIDAYKGQSVGVLGLGQTGLATARALLAGGARVLGWDDSAAVREAARLDLLDLALRPPEASDWCGVSALMPSPGISETHDLIQRLDILKIPMLGDVELFGRAVKASGAAPEIIAITGTNGKSTVTALSAHMLECAGFDVEMGGNIGVPVLALSPPRDDLVYVLEISSYQAARLEDFTPTIAVQLNLTPDHIERHGSLEAYAAAKARIFQRMRKNHLAIINRHDRFGRKLARQVAAKTKIAALDTAKLPRLPKPIPPHQRQNVAAAWAIAKAMGIAEGVFAFAYASFQSLPHRMEEVAQIGELRFINDSKATNAVAARQALAAYRDIYWLAGGAAKSGGFDDLASELSHIRHAYLFGAAALELSQFLGDKVAWSMHSTLRAAARQACRDAEQGVVLLSPACASFDAYHDFAARGRAFRSYIRDYVSRQRARISGVKIFIAAGGTGGGIFPAESLADILRQRGYHCSLMSDRRAAPYITPARWDRVYWIASAPIAGAVAWHRWLRWLDWLKWPVIAWRMGRGAAHAFFILLFQRSRKIIIGFGGYPIVPPCLAAYALRQPIILHEPGRILGRANRVLLPLARRLATAAPLAKGERIGTPARLEVVRWHGMPYRLPRKHMPFRLVVFGGSQGSELFDEIIPQALILLAQAGYRLDITQQCRSEQEVIEALYRKTRRLRFKLAPFFPDLPRHLARAHLAITRAGASTISELALLGRPAILIPLIGAPAKEQRANAEQLARDGAAWVMDQNGLTAKKLAQQIKKLIDDPDRLREAARNAHRQADPDASAKLADLVEEVAHA